MIYIGVVFVFRFKNRLELFSSFLRNKRVFCVRYIDCTCTYLTKRWKRASFLKDGWPKLMSLLQSVVYSMQK